MLTMFKLNPILCSLPIHPDVQLFAVALEEMGHLYRLFFVVFEKYRSN